MPTELPEPGAPDVLYIVDLTGYVFRAYHALPPMSTAAGEPTHAIYGVTRMLLALIKTQRPTKLAVALDPGGPSFRKDIYPEYKATRPRAPDDLRPQIERLSEVVDAYGIPVLVVPGFEADDVIATVIEPAREAGMSVVVVSADKDLLQLVSADVIMLDSMRERVYGVDETVQKMGVPPHQLRDYLAMVGDSSDNVPGVPSVGPKTAAALLSEHPDLDLIYENIETLKKKAVKKKLLEFKDQAYLSQRLVTLRTDVPLELDLDALAYGGADDERLRELFTKLEFHQLVNQLAPRPVGPVDYELATSAAEVEAVLSAAKEAGHLALHFITEGDDVWRAPIAGLALSTAENSARYVPLGHLGLDAPSGMLGLTALGDVLRAVLEDPAVQLSVGDSKRARTLLARLGVDPKGITFDAMLASYLVDPERHGHSLEEISQSELHRPLTTYAELTDKRRGYQRALCDVEVERAKAYACERADLCAALPGLMEARLTGQGLSELLADVELPLAETLARMEREGIRVDVAHLAELSAKYGETIDSLEERAYALAGKRFKISSPRALETILFDELELPVIKKTRTSRSTDAEVLEQLSSEHELPKVILEYRSLEKLRGTYLDALPKQVNPKSGRIHTRFNQAVAATGRMSSSEPNLQNIPIRTDAGRAIRDAFVPRDGWKLLSADYSQVELRILAHLSEDEELVEAFSNDEDVHVRTAAAIFGIERADVTRKQRGEAKTVNYAVIYGQTQFALARNLGIERAEAKRYIEAFFARYAGVTRFMDETVAGAEKSGGVRTLLGRWRMLPNIRSKNRGLKAAAERVARNTPIQGSAADLMKVAMVRIDRELEAGPLQSRMLLTVHDELVFEVAPDEEEALSALVRRGMEQVHELRVPLKVDLGVGQTWNAAH